MIKFVAKGKEGKTLIGLGITDMNIEKLKEGKPIYVHGSEVGVDDLNIAIFYGKTEEDIYKDFKEHGIQIDKVIDKKGTLDRNDI